MSTTGRRPGMAAPRGAVLTVLFTVAVVHLSVGFCRSLSSNGLKRDGGSREMARDSRQPGESSATDPSGETPFSGSADPSEPLPFVRTGPEGGGGDGAVRTAPFLLVSGRRRSLAEGLQGGHPDHLVAGVQVGGELYLLDLEKNHDLLPKAPNIFYYLPNGTGVSTETDPPTHCFYQGTVRGYPTSRAALSTCSGLRGVVALNATLSWELRPADPPAGGKGGGGGGGAAAGVHLMYRTGPLEGSGPGDCGVSRGPVPPLHAAPHTPRLRRDLVSETKYIELVLVADHQEYVNYQKSNKTIIYRLLDIANQVDWFYRPLNVRVALVGLEIWSDQDRITVERSPADTLNHFLEWRSRELLPRLHHDNAQLVMGGSFDGTTVGMASQSSMCSKDRSGGVNVDHLVSILGVASTVAHELGHNLGMSHDTAERRCQCLNEARQGGCIMEPSTGFMPGQQFSSCSAQDLTLSLGHGGGMCLFNVPQPERLLGGARCGNLYVEKGEECDCGLLQECDDPCCNASTCRLQPGAQCSATGTCCEDCRLRAAGWPCRDPLGECDLPEFCTGASPHCPANVFLQNGEPCEDSASYCYGGFCAGLSSQCQALWGANASHAPPLCFSSVNKQGNKYGNCGQTSNGSYIACRSADVLCGKLQCQGGSERPVLSSGAEILTTKVQFNHSDLVCRGTYLDLGDDVSDPASVAQGTACGPHKACVDQRCQHVSVFRVDECRGQCYGHGVCNSNMNCHCEAGWAPPDCRYAGHGGSVDSGPSRTPGSTDPVRVALLVIFLFVLPVVLLFLMLRFPRCRRGLLCLGAGGPFNKSRQHNRTPATERVDDCNGEQVLPLRYQWNGHGDIPLTAPANKRRTAPSKPLPPDPYCPGHQQQVRPAPPNRPLPPDPKQTLGQVPVRPKPPVPAKPSPLDLPPQPPQPGYAPVLTHPPPGAVAPAGLPNRRAPPPPSKPAIPRKPAPSPL
ncbi:disintegrin and metalloproteinase domain-containing protein 15 isoform X3 [Gadus morhua]|uniref:disintegrin and metalloproteinase domain-containing protein 15 isoform X3 n=1 Tax=Gadus morhua TaxID=8049 RepID=UPI0011B53C50|nr:disintegrin and metalloproteinase domain-containing protein 15 isoform X3 [Gadus morhua]